MRTRAAVLRSPEADFVLEDLELPELAAGEVLLRVAGTGLCHTDFIPREGGMYGRPPIVVGHESSGTIAAVAAEVCGLEIGQPVVASFAFCGKCGACLAGQPTICRDFFRLNMLGAPKGSRNGVDADGAPVATRWFGQSSCATYAVVRAQCLVPISTRLPLEWLGTLGCGFLTGAASIFTAFDVKAGASVAVLGAGGVGLAAIMAAKLAGADPLIAVDRNSERLRLAAKFGATAVISGDEPELVAGLSGYQRPGFDYVLDTTGHPAVIAATADMLAPGGVCGLVAYPRGPLSFSSTTLTFGRQVRSIVMGDAIPSVAIPELIRHWESGALPFHRLITTYPLDAIVEAEHDVRAGRVVKPVLVPGHVAAQPRLMGAGKCAVPQ
jgi:aryl-alcohol dehydrogenase